jgi:tRNA1Val (adenine37-N6)-methyltransferase
MRKIPPPGEAPGPGETLDQLIGDWWVFQLRGGHRFSTDDLVAAWRGALARPAATRLLDLGCGIGSVGLYTLGILDRDGPGGATLVGLEAQEVSVGLARRSVRRNGLAERVTIHHGDLRASQDALGDATFELVTGSPPYVPPDKGVHSPHPQRAACRMELRGSVIDYCHAARRHMAPNARFSFVMAAADPRIQQGLDEAGLVAVERLDVTFREGNAPLICVVVAARREDVDPSAAPALETLTIRTRDGQMTPEYRAFRRSMGFSTDDPSGDSAG